MKKIIVLLVLASLFACELPTSRDITIEWDSSKTRVFINGSEVYSGRYSESFPLDIETVEIDCIVDETDGVFLDDLIRISGPWQYSDWYDEFPALVSLDKGSNEISFNYRKVDINEVRRSGNTIYAEIKYPHFLNRDNEYASFNMVTGLYTKITQSDYSIYGNMFLDNEIKGDLSFRFHNSRAIAVYGSQEKEIPVDFSDSQLSIYNHDTDSRAAIWSYSFNQDSTKAIYVVNDNNERMRFFIWNISDNSMSEVPFDYSGKPGYTYEDFCWNTLLRNNQVYVRYSTTNRLPDTSYGEGETDYMIFAKYDLAANNWEEIHRKSDSLTSPTYNNVSYYMYRNYYLKRTEIRDVSYTVYDYSGNELYSSPCPDLEGFLGYDPDFDAVFYCDKKVGILYKKEGQPAERVFSYADIK